MGNITGFAAEKPDLYRTSNQILNMANACELTFDEYAASLDETRSGSGSGGGGGGGGGGGLRRADCLQRVKGSDWRLRLWDSDRESAHKPTVIAVLSDVHADHSNVKQALLGLRLPRAFNELQAGEKKRLLESVAMMPRLKSLDICEGGVWTTRGEGGAGATPVGAKALAKGLLNHQAMTSLNVSANRLGAIPMGIGSIADALFTMRRSLVKVNLSDNELTAKGGKVLAEKALRGNNVMRELDISSNYLGYNSIDDEVKDLSGVCAIGEALSTMGALVRLNALNNNMFGNNDTRGIQAWANALQTHASLVDLDLAMNHLRPRDAEILANGVRANGTLTALNLRSNLLFDDPAAGAIGGNALSNMLAENATLKALDVSRNALQGSASKGGQAFAEGLAAGLRANERLVKFDISGNPIRAGGVEALVKALTDNYTDNSTMTALNLANTDLMHKVGAAPGDEEHLEGFRALLNALPTMTALKSVNIVGNSIGKERLSELQTVERAHPKLVSLCGIADGATMANLVSIGMDADDAAVLAAELPAKGALTRLTLSHNKMLTTDAGKALAGALAANSSLKELDVSINNWQKHGHIGDWMGDGPGFAKELAVGLGANGGLEKLLIRNNRMATEEAGKAIAEALTQNSVLKELDLSGNSWDDTRRTGGTKGDGPGFATALADGIKNNGAMTSLNISNNSVGEIVTADGWSYSKATTGQMAYFKDGKGQLAAPPGCGPLGVIALADAIKTNGALTSLSIRNNGLDDRGLQAILPAVSTSRIAFLDLSRNRARSNESAKALVEMVQQQGALTALNIRLNQLTAEQRAPLRALCEAKRITLKE
jgi:Ran GTPase-activating protein (RanGAP) involved in mRNA processing and transport